MEVQVKKFMAAAADPKSKVEKSKCQVISSGFVQVYFLSSLGQGTIVV